MTESEKALAIHHLSRMVKTGRYLDSGAHISLPVLHSLGVALKALKERKTGKWVAVGCMDICSECGASRENQIAEIRATDVAEITAFREKIDAEVEKTKQVGGRYIAYISWKVSQTAIEALAQEYRERGFEVGYDDDEVAYRKYTRGFWLEWKNVGR